MSLSRGPLVVRTLPVVALLLLYAVAASAVAERSPCRPLWKTLLRKELGRPRRPGFSVRYRCGRGP